MTIKYFNNPQIGDIAYSIAVLSQQTILTNSSIAEIFGDYASNATSISGNAESVAYKAKSIADRISSLAVISTPSIGEHKVYSIKRTDTDFVIDWESDPII